jgi:hypothetical protein
MSTTDKRFVVVGVVGNTDKSIVLIVSSAKSPRLPLISQQTNNRKSRKFVNAGSRHDQHT